jgi:hypothetical protein
VRRTSGSTRADRPTSPQWVVDYDVARAQAIRWLGDRYLLAHPINRPLRAQSVTGANPATRAGGPEKG